MSIKPNSLLAKFSVPVPPGDVADDSPGGLSGGGSHRRRPFVVKAQIHAGGRGKGGGVKVAASLAEVNELADAILGMKLVTHQTGPEGRLVKKVLVEQALDIKQELYLGVVIDRAQARPVIMMSAAAAWRSKRWRPAPLS
jgi:succinyl-CoA synthetase beta subunit